jgi:hypothetical protein
MYSVYRFARLMFKKEKALEAPFSYLAEPGLLIFLIVLSKSSN